MIHTRPLIDDLSRQMRQLEHVRAHNGQSWAVECGSLGHDIVSSGVKELDALLPRGGFRTGTITEWLSPVQGCGASTLTLCLAAHCVRDDRALAIVDFAGDFYPPTASSLGVDLRKAVVIKPSSKTDGFWALEQILRSTAIGAVWCNLNCMSDRMQTRNSTARAPSQQNNTTADSQLFRRLQLASESGECVSFLMRPMSARREPSWADLRFSVKPSINANAVNPSVNVSVLRSRDSFAQGQVNLRLPQTGGFTKVNGEFHPESVDLFRLPAC